ncbi:non-ribosomal peptide synthetase [Streptomyces alfalfae]|uniref:AMP-binding protein n=1 Tax=Streptomyces alfalfae TaxID=1642299 RepID=A0A7T4PJN2_9ACTN|nr:AMP-binding protein [Streptomyces alfalfae]QQC91378.1 AMP-binding protein [Streptomyces alfalfae]
MSGRIADVLPLTPVQEGLLFHAVRDTEGPDPYVVQARFHTGPAVTASALRSALAALLERHPNLRACFRHARLDRPVQVIPHAVTPPWTEADLTTLPTAEAEARTEELLADDRARRFDLTRPPLLRALFLRRADGGELVLTFHHILLDGWSVPVLERDLAALVAGESLPPAVPYRNYALWLSRQDQGRAMAAWRDALAGLERPAPLVPRDGDGAAEPDTVRRHLTAELTAALARRAAAAGVTLNTLAQTAWALVLARLTGGRDLVFGGVVAGRPHDLPGAGEMVGLFINTLPVRIRLRDGETVGELLARVQDEQSRLVPYHHVRLAEVRRGLAGGAGAGELFDSVLAFENFPRGAEKTPDGPHTVRARDVRDATHYPVTLAVVAGERMLLSVGCRYGLSAEAVTARVVRAFEQLAGDPAAPADRVDVLPDAEHRELLARAAGAPAAALPGPATVTARFADRAARTPDAPAVESGDDVLTYADLDAASGRLARRLVAAGVTPGATVALLLPRSPSLVVAQLAVLKAGACWLPLDPAQPGERVRRLLGAASAGLVVSRGEPSLELPAGVRHVDLAAESPEAAELVDRSHPEAPACVMYTSGSSGEPKGVVVPQRAIAELAADSRFRDAGPVRGAGGVPEAGRAREAGPVPDARPVTEAGESPHRRVLLHSPHTFDAATYEVWVPLLNGGTVVVCPDEPVTPDLLARVLPERGVTALWLTAELFRTVADLAPASLSAVREVWTGGDVVDPEAVRRVRDACPGTAVVNGYGPTEATVFATAHRVPRFRPGGPLPIGTPLDGTRAHVLDARLRPVPDGCAGEVYLAGAGLAHGYLGRPAATAERFVADPYGEPGARMYRTGDLARRNPDGSLAFAGRADDQVKVRGFRVEPAEVEAALASCPGVTRAAVAARPAPDGGKRLVAWVVLEERAPGDAEPGAGEATRAAAAPEAPRAAAAREAAGGAAAREAAGGAAAPEAAGGAAARDADALARVRAAAAHVLPAHLLPTAWVCVDAVPLTPHGKADRAALPEPTAVEQTSRAPATVREKELCALFGDVLGLTDAGPDTDFFASGGHSLSALRLADKIEAAWQVRVPVAALFAAPTPAGLIARLDGPAPEGAGADSLAPLLTLRAGGARTPLFCVHPGLGVSWAYKALLPHLREDRPVYALQAPALSEDGPLPADVRELAATYVGHVRSVRPHGPYLLLGRSFGGPVAHEMAVLLRALGEEVALLAVVDAMPKPPEVARAPLAEAVVREEARRILREEGVALRGIGERRLTALGEAIARHVELGRSWVPSPYDGTVTLFAATRDPEAVPTEAKAGAWRRAATAVEVHELACAHAEVLDAEPAARIAAALETAIETALPQGPEVPLPGE